MWADCLNDGLIGDHTVGGMSREAKNGSEKMMSIMMMSVVLWVLVAFKHDGKRKKNTVVTHDGDGGFVVTLHGTDIVKVDRFGRITLKTGGYRTHTTRTRINQVSDEYALGFRVFQKNFTWYIEANGTVEEWVGTYSLYEYSYRADEYKIGASLGMKHIPHLKHGMILEHKTFKNADGTPMRVKVTGMPQAYKRDPMNARIPIKHGLYNHGTLDRTNVYEWRLS